MSSTEMADDARFELALAASAHERANRPRAVVAAAVVAVVVAAVVALWGWSSLRSARSGLRAALNEQVEVEAMTREWEKLDRQERENGAGGQPGTGRQITDLYSRMEQLATRAGLKDKPQPPRANESLRGPIKIIEYTYNNVRDASLKALLEWTRLASAEIPGMEVYGLTLKPDPNNWNLVVTFRRWERTQ